MHWQPFFLTLFCALAAVPCFSKHHTASSEKLSESAAQIYCFFTPPQGWEIADPKSLSPRVKMAFFKNTKKGFCPSINLAIEETPVSLTEYLKAVRTIHEQDRSNCWRALGKVRTAAGLAQLTEIDASTEWGPIRILQLILLKDGSAYVITAAALKEEFSNYYKEIQSAFRTLTLSSNLFNNIPQLERRETLKQKQRQLIEAARQAMTAAVEPQNPLADPLFQERYWLPFEKTIVNQFNDMGTFWQMLLLSSAQEKLLAAFSSASQKQPEIPPQESTEMQPSEANKEE